MTLERAEQETRTRLQLEKIVAASRERVFAAFTDAEQLERFAQSLV